MRELMLNFPVLHIPIIPHGGEPRILKASNIPHCIIYTVSKQSNKVQQNANEQVSLWSTDQMEIQEDKRTLADSI